MTTREYTEEKSENNTYRSSDQSLNSLNLKSRESERVKQSQGTKSVYGDYSTESFRTIIKEKVEFYKKDNSCLKEKAFVIENEMSKIRKENEFLDKENKELVESNRELKEKITDCNGDLHRLDNSRTEIMIQSKDKENNLLKKEIESLKKKVNEHEKNMQTMMKDNKNFRMEMEKNIKMYQTEITKLKSRNENNFEIVENKDIKSINESFEKKKIIELKVESVSTIMYDRDVKYCNIVQENYFREEDKYEAKKSNKQVLLAVEKKTSFKSSVVGYKENPFKVNAVEDADLDNLFDKLSNDKHCSKK